MAVKVVLSIGVLAYGFLLLLSQQFIAVFTPGDPELLRFTFEKGLLHFWGILFAGFNILFISFWQALKQTKSMAVSLLRSIIALPVLIAVLPFFFGSESIWYCFSLSEALTAAAAFLIYLRQRKKARRNSLEKYAIITGEASSRQFE